LQLLFAGTHLVEPDQFAQLFAGYIHSLYTITASVYPYIHGTSLDFFLYIIYLYLLIWKYKTPKLSKSIALDDQFLFNIRIFLYL